MSVLVNGERRETPDGTTVSALVAQLELVPATVLIEHNGVALHRREWERVLVEGDRLEFLRVVAGG
ncbi:MAG: sulfur carrier protein ThiS [Verrucomicrobiota bacterium]|nr:sulfur carrier protein ThiS [Verrucomicrobiota bacterium]